MIVSALPSSARARRGGSSAVTRNTTQVSAEAQRRGGEHADLGLASCAPWNASEAISSDTMKPIPAMAPAPATAAQPTGGRIGRRLTRLSSHAAPSVPIGLPST